MGRSSPSGYLAHMAYSPPLFFQSKDLHKGAKGCMHRNGWAFSRQFGHWVRKAANRKMLDPFTLETLATKPISDARLGQYKLGIGRVVFDLSSQSPDVRA